MGDLPFYVGFSGHSIRKGRKKSLDKTHVIGFDAVKAIADNRININNPAERRDIDRIAGVIDDGKPLESELVKKLIKQAGIKDYDYRVIPIADRRRLALEVIKESKNESDERNHWKRLLEWADGDLKIESPKGSSLHHLLRYHAEVRKTKGKPPTSLAKLTEEWHDFVVEQDWAALFPTDLADKDAQWRLPFEKTVMEFRINGIRVLAFMEQDEGSEKIKCALLAFGIEKHWYSAPLFWEVDAGVIRWMNSTRVDEKDLSKEDLVFNRVFDQVCVQARSIAIMLDAEVVTRDAVEPSSGLVKKAKREGKAAPERYHIISLKARFRSKERGEATGRHLEGWHWRRGHWRHYEGNAGQIKYLSEEGYPRSKTWIKWQTIGNTEGPFRGGKEYRA